jgi:hypothetical protein
MLLLVREERNYLKPLKAFGVPGENIFTAAKHTLERAGNMHTGIAN